jgi:hypothetical protein
MIAARDCAEGQTRDAVSRTIRIGLLVGVACALLVAACSVRGALALPDLGFTTQPTATPTPPISTAPTLTPTRTRTSFPTRTPEPPTRTPTAPATNTPPAPPTPPRPTSTPTRPGVATVPPGQPPLGVASATPTELSIVIPSPVPTDLPLSGPAPTSTVPSFSAGEVPDLLATAIEVTQGMQNVANDMPLVEGRLTVARVYVRTQDPDVPYANIKGALAGFRDGQLLGVIFPENGPISAVPDGGLRLNLDDSLYFYLPGAWTTGELLLRTFVYSTTPDAPYEQEPDETNNFLDESVVFHAGTRLDIRLAPLHLHAYGVDTNPDWTYHFDEHEGDALKIVLGMLRLHPLATDDLGWSASSHLVVESEDGGPNIAVSSIKPIGHQGGFEWDLRESADRDAVNERIKFFKSMAPEQYDGYRWYGMADNRIDMGNYAGWANNGVAHGLMSPARSNAIWNINGSLTIAHEIAHLYLSAPEHVECAGGEQGPDPAYPYPFPNCQLADIDPAGFYGFDQYWQLFGLDGPTVIGNDPAGPQNQYAFPMMGGKGPRFVDPFYYCRLLDAYGVPCDPLAMNITTEPVDGPAEAHAHAPGTASHSHNGFDSSPQFVRATQEPGGYIYVSARVDAAADTAAFLHVMRMVDPAPSAIEASRIELEEDVEPSAYAVTFEDAAGGILSVYRVPLPEPSAHEAPAGNPLFTSIVVYPEGTAFIRVRRDAEILAERAVSATAPTVRVLSPNGDEDIGGGMEIAWEYVDADGDALTFTVMYSADGGESWTPLATDVRSNAITLPSLDGIAGSENALIRVLATDGVLTGYDDSDAAFSVPESAPEAYIAGPLDGATFAEGATVALVGGATDAEDGSLTGASLSWSSNVDGELGTGTLVTAQALSRGAHTITLVATDSAGATSERTVEITVGEPRPGRPDEDERERAADYLVNGRDDGGGTPWVIIGIVAAVAVVVVGGGAAAVGLRRRAAA